MLDKLYCPDVDSDVVLPISASEAFPEISPQEEVNMRARTIKLLSDLSGEPIIAGTEDQSDAEILARAMAENPELRPEFSKYSDPTIAYLAGMVARSNVQLVDELSELKNYVTTKLVYEIEHAKTSKDRISALRLLGEVDGVDAFKRRTELTVQLKPIEEVEKELKSVIEALEYQVTEIPEPPETSVQVSP
jgi:hypothetical protein